MRCLWGCLAAFALLGACASTPPFDAPEQPALAALAMPYAPDLRALGITRLVSPGGGALVRLETAWGAVYVPYPRDVPPVAFELSIDEGGMRAAAGSFDADRDARVLASLMPAVFRETASNNTIQWWRANPWR
jgi:hypothetical protein